MQLVRLCALGRVRFMSRENFYADYGACAGRNPVPRNFRPHRFAEIRIFPEYSGEKIQFILDNFEGKTRV